MIGDLRNLVFQSMTRDYEISRAPLKIVATDTKTGELAYSLLYLVGTDVQVAIDQVQRSAKTDF
jgi:hypothetical protein